MTRLHLDIAESPLQLKTLMTQQKDPRAKERIHALYLLKSGLVEQEQAVAHLLARGTATIRRWLGAYRRGGIEALLGRATSTGRPRSVPPHAVAALRERLADPHTNFQSYGEAQRWLADCFGVEVDYKVVHSLIKYRLKSSLRVPRPSNARQDPAAVETFKKT